MRKPTDYTLLAVLLVLLIAVIAASCTRNTISEPLLNSRSSIPNVTTYLYNAYSPLYDEHFVIKSYTPLSVKEVVWFDDNATAVNYSTEYVAMIISPYNKNQ